MVNESTNEDGKITRTYAAWAEAGNNSVAFSRPSVLEAPRASQFFMYDIGEFVMPKERSECETID